MVSNSSPTENVSGGRRSGRQSEFGSEIGSQVGSEIGPRLGIGSEFAICAELEVCHSRVVAPTRRVALGSLELPDDYGPVLLGCVAGWFSQGQDDEFFSDAAKLLAYASTRTPIPQPHMRYRFQQDLVGLLVSSHLICEEVGLANGKKNGKGDGDGQSDGGDGGKNCRDGDRSGRDGGKNSRDGGNRSKNLFESLKFVSDTKSSTPAQHVLGALYAAHRLEDEAHWQSCEMIELALEWAVERPPGSLKGTSTRLGITGMEAKVGTESERSELLRLLVKSTGVSEANGSNNSGRNRFDGSNMFDGGNRSDGSNMFDGGNRSDGRHRYGSHRLSSLTLAHRWAMKVMEFEEPEADTLSEAIIQTRFRTLLREAHPDSGGNPKEAPTRISDLSEARRILIG